MADPGWYPQADGTQRYWDGHAWTEHVEQPTPKQTEIAAEPDQPDPGKKRSTWWRSKAAIGVGAGTFGLLVGAALGASGAGDDEALNTRISALSSQKSDLKDQVAGLKEDAEEAEAARQAAIDQQVAAAVDEANKEATAAQEAAVAAAVAAERAKADERVAAAEEEAQANQPKTLVGNGGGATDPRFDTCGEANDKGYGPYTEGEDPEYDWYQDRDGDGEVCEP